MGFQSYLQGLIRKAVGVYDGTTAALAAAFGLVFDQIKEAANRMRRNWYIGTCDDDALKERGRERRFYRYPSETKEQFRQRLNAAVEIYAEGGTLPGMTKLLQRLGFPNAVIHELYKDGSIPSYYNGQSRHDGQRIYDAEKRWAEFKVVTDIDRNATLTPADYTRLVRAINEAKPGHSRLAAFSVLIAMSDRVVWTETMSWKVGRFAEEALTLDEVMLIVPRKQIHLDDALPGSLYYVGAARYDGESLHQNTGVGDSLRALQRKQTLADETMAMTEVADIKTVGNPNEIVEVEETMEVQVRNKVFADTSVKGELLYAGDAEHDGDMAYDQPEKITDSLKLVIRTV